MGQSAITFVINGKTYSLRASDTAAIGAIPPDERQQLIALLEAVRQQEERSQAIAQKALDKIAPAPANASSGDAYPYKPERLGSGDADALMARLIMEEQSSRKPGLTKQVLYKWVLGFAVVIILLVLIL